MKRGEERRDSCRPARCVLMMMILLLEQLLESFQLRYPGVEFPPLPPRGDLDVTEVLAADYFFS